MTSAQLTDLEMRCYKAIQKGHLIGKGDVLAHMLMVECGAVDTSPDTFGSPQHLLKLIRAIKDVRSGKAKPAPEPKPISTEPEFRVPEPKPISTEPEFRVPEPKTKSDKARPKKGS